MKNSESPMAGLFTVPVFFLRNANIFASEQSIRWYLRDRANNGLLESGAVVELRAHPESKRPKVFVDENKFLEWMRSRGMLGVAAA